MGLIHFNFLSRHLGFQTDINVILPTYSMEEASKNSYDFYKPGMKFQVLYLLHGGSGDYQDYIKFSNIVRYAEKHKLCVVMPSGYNARYSDVLNGPRYFRYLAEELPLLCQTIFPISNRREDTFVAGLSMGGQGAMKLAVMYPEQYSVALCMSGAPFNPDTIKMLKRPSGTGNESAEAMPAPNAERLWGNLDLFKGSVHDAWHYARKNIEEGKKKVRFFFACGDADPNKGVVDDAYEYMTNLGYDTTYEVGKGFDHEWDFWDLTLKRAFEEKWFPLKDCVIQPD